MLTRGLQDDHAYKITEHVFSMSSHKPWSQVFRPGRRFLGLLVLAEGAADVEARPVEPKSSRADDYGQACSNQLSSKHRPRRRQCLHKKPRISTVSLEGMHGSKS